MAITSTDVARAARCVTASLDGDDLMLRAAIEDALEQDGGVNNLLKALTEIAVHAYRKHEDDHAIREDLHYMIVAGLADEE